MNLYLYIITKIFYYLCNISWPCPCKPWYQTKALW